MTVLTLPRSAASSLSVRAKALVFEDSKSRELQERIAQVAPSDATLLVTGETGTGKEIVARHVHALSSRKDRQFLAINCGAFSESLAESELFGHERGAFTGAVATKAGWFEAANGGTLFLDEIGDLSLSLQVKLLRVLQEAEVVRLGSRKPIAIDVRLIAATNVDLEEAVTAGRFREDLFYRLNVANLSLPPLRERPGDILPLAEYFLERYRDGLGATVAAFTEDARCRLLEHAWPGNIRELENVVHNALLLCRQDAITSRDLRLTSLTPRVSPPNGLDAATNSLENALTTLFEFGGPNLHERIEKTIFRAAYRFCDSNQVQTAKLLDTSRNIVRARLIESGTLAGALRSRPSAAPSEEPVSAERETVQSPALSERSTVKPRDATPPGRFISETVRIGFQHFWLPMLLRARGTLTSAFAEHGVAVEWRSYDGGLEIIDALAASRVSLGVVGEGPPVFAEAAELPIMCLAAETAAPDSEAILVHRDSPIRTVGDLRGKIVAVTRGSNVHYLLLRALEEAGVDPTNVRIEYLSPVLGRSAFESHRVDAWGIWDPVLASVQHVSGARVLRSAIGLARNTTYYLGATSFAETRPNLVAAFLTELRQTAAWARAHSSAAARTLAEHYDMPEEALASALRGGTDVQALDADLLASQEAVANAFHRSELIPATLGSRRPEWQWVVPRSAGGATDARV